jgi:hypothetical protein
LLGDVVVWVGVGLGAGCGELAGGSMTGAEVVGAGAGFGAPVCVRRGAAVGLGLGFADVADGLGEGEAEVVGEGEALVLAAGGASSPAAGASAATGADRAKSATRATVASELSWVMRQVSLDSRRRPSWRSASAGSLCRPCSMLLVPARWSRLVG